MKKNISIRKNIYSSNKYKEVINTDFSELFSTRENFTIEDFFDLYNELFLQIPETGEFSHEALVRKSGQLITPGNDAKDDEIENLQSTIEDLQKQLLDASKPNTEVDVVREHPRFPNGTIIRRASGGGFPYMFLMDQGFKRAITFTESNKELRAALVKLSGYTGDSGQGDNPVPTVPNSIIDKIPSGTDLTVANFNDPFEPSAFLAEAEDLRITLDPTDAKLNIDKYNGDYDRYKRELEKDYREKTNYLKELDDKISDIRKEIQSITGG
jgi:hypothetical protein